MKTPCQSSPRDAEDKNNSSWLRHAHTPTHTHVHTGGVIVRPGLNRWASCMWEWGTRPRSEPLSGREIVCLGRGGWFYESCQQCYYSILNFDVLLGLSAPWHHHAYILYSGPPCSNAQPSVTGQSTSQKRRGPQYTQPLIKATRGIKFSLARTDYFVNNIYRSKSTITRKL